jgi:hypothetical protein
LSGARRLGKIPVKINRLIAIIPLIGSAVFSLRAQPAAVQQLQNTELMQQQQNLLPALINGTNAPELYPGENADIGPQRILRVNPRPDFFDVLFDSQFFYTDNANFATGTNNLGSGVFVNTVQFAFTPPDLKWGNGKFAPSVGFVSQWYNYENSQMASFDFEAQIFFVSGKYSIGNWLFGAGANYTRLLSQENYDQTYSEFLPAVSVQRIFPIGDKLLFAVSDQIGYHFTTVPTLFNSRADINDRLDEIVNATLSWQLTRKLVLQPYYRFQYSNYKNNTAVTSDRNDYLQTCGITLAYYFNKNLSARTFFNYSLKQSDDPSKLSYHEIDGGLGASLDFKF